MHWEPELLRREVTYPPRDQTLHQDRRFFEAKQHIRELSRGLVRLAPKGVEGGTEKNQEATLRASSDCMG